MPIDLNALCVTWSVFPVYKHSELGVPVRMFQLESRRTDFDEMWCGYRAGREYSKLVHFKLQEPKSSTNMTDEN
jgi:hypothetical protein